MKITAIEAIHLRAEDPLIELFDGSYDDCVLVVHTDEGITGIGETESMAPAIQAIVKRTFGSQPCPFALGSAGRRRSHRSCRAVASHVRVNGLCGPPRPCHARHRRRRPGAVGSEGKIEGKPVHELLGGAKRDRVPAYGTIYPMARTEEDVRAQVAEGQSKKLRNFKFAADPWWLDDIALTGRLLTAARKQAGDDSASDRRRCALVPHRTGGLEALSHLSRHRAMVP